MARGVSSLWIFHIYDRLGYKAKAKGTDIKLYGYSTHKVKIRIGDKRLDGVELTMN